jgi:D-xylose transport system ATP-binding protein
MSENILQTQQDVPVLEVKNISKKFSHVQALNNVSIKLNKGDIIGLLGDNGAGKSTLIKIISGNFPPDEGKVFLEGKEVNFNTPAEACAAGIETVYQNSPICTNITVLENFFIGRELVRNFFGLKVIKNQEMKKETLKVLKDIEIAIPSIDVEMGLLSGGQRQAIILGRFFHWGGKVALLDEPFAALGIVESRKSLKLINDVSAKGLPIVLITHNIEHAFQIVNKYVVLRRGEVVGAGRKEDVSKNDIVSMITGAININK